MATIEQLTAAYVAVNDGLAPDAATLEQLGRLALLTTTGSATDAQAYGYVLNGADGTTALAMLSYQFFTGKSVTKAGLDYLTNSPGNPNDLNDPYYGQFNTENRYINFAANLGVAGAGAADFAAKYGQMSYGAYVAAIYETIIGSSYAERAHVDKAAAIADIISRHDAILATAQSAGMITPGMTAAQIDLAVKAATAGYLMAESVKSDIGAYAAAADAFMIDMATGQPHYNIDLPALYGGQPGFGLGQAVPNGFVAPPLIVTPDPPSGPVSHAFVLTTGTDTFTGDILADTFTARDTTFTNGDVLDGGGGADTLNIASSSGLAGPAVTVQNIETANFHVAGSFSVNASGWTGLTQANIVNDGGPTTFTAASTTDVSVTQADQGASTIFVGGGHDTTIASTGATTGQINVIATGAVTISRETTGAVTAASITVRGGTTVDITQTASNAIGTTQTNGAVQILGGADTTSVTLKAAAPATASGSVAGVTAGFVLITDVNFGSSTLAGTIHSVDIDGYASATIAGTGLTTLKLAHGSSDVLINNSGLAVPINQTLGLTLDGLTGGNLTATGVITTLNVTTGAEASTLANILMGAVTALNIGGASQLTLTSPPGMGALQTMTVSGAAGLSANLAGSTVTSVDASATSGDMTVSIDGSSASYAGGAGVDIVTLTPSVLSHSVTGGGGTGDILTMDATMAATVSPGLVSGFEHLVLTGATNQTIDLAPLGGITDVQTRGGNNLTLANFASDGTLHLTGAGTAYTISSGFFAGGANDVVNIALSDATGTGADFASNGISAAGVETLNITTVDNQATPSGLFNDTLTLLGNGFKTITVAGNAGLALTAFSSALTNVDASGVTLGGFTFTTGFWTSAGTIKGSANGTNTIDVSATQAGAAVTYFGGAGDDHFTNSNTNANTIHLGEGANSVTGASNGATTVTAGAGDDTVTLGGGNNTVTLGGGNNTFTATSGDNSYTGGAGNDTVNVGGGANRIDVGDVGSGFDWVRILAPGADSSHFTTITGMSAGDILSLSAATTQTVLTSLGDQSSNSLLDMLNLATINNRAAGDAVYSWATFGGDTYIIMDHSNNLGFTNGVDQVVKLTGLIDLSTASSAANVITL